MLYKENKRESCSPNKMADVVLKGLYKHSLTGSKETKMIDDILEEHKIFFNQELLGKVVTILREKKFIEPLHGTSQPRQRIGTFDGEAADDLETASRQGNLHYALKAYKITPQGTHFVVMHQTLDEQSINEEKGLGKFWNFVSTHKIWSGVIAGVIVLLIAIVLARYGFKSS